MNVGQIISAVIVFGIAVILIVLSINHFLEKGYLLNNAFIYASKEQRAAMDKKHYYRQSAIVFSLLSVVFFIIGISVLTKNYKFELTVIPIIAGTVLYAAISTGRINKNTK